MGNDIISMATILEKNAVFYPNKIAVVDVDRKEKYTYKEFNERTNRIANAMLELGLKKGDKVAALFYNSPQMLETFWACNKVGMVWVAVNFRYSSQEIIDVLNDSEAAVLFYGNEFYSVVASIVGKVKNVRYYVKEADQVESGEIKYSDFVSKGSLENPKNSDIGDDDLSSLLYTGGTTGKSKGSMITHRQQFSAAWNMAAFGVEEDDIFFASPPMFHGAGMQDTSPVFMALGMTIVTPPRGGNIKEQLKYIRDEKCTVVFFVPTQIHMIVREIPDFHKYMQSVKIWLVAASPFPIELYDVVKQALPNVDMRNWYGITENLTCSILRGKDAKKLPSVGKPILGLMAKIVDPTDFTKELPIGEVGEIILRGPTTSSGYYKDKERTAETFKDGWLLTGDLGKVDEEGFLYVVDRKKDLIITGGENVYAPEVEAVVCEHPDVLQVSVIGVPSAKWGEMVTAVVLKKKGKEINENEIIKFSREKLAAFKCPKIVTFTDEFPISPAGKILKRELRERYKDLGDA